MGVSRWLERLETIEPGILVLNEELVTTFANRHALQLLGGKHADGVLGQSLFEVHEKGVHNRLVDVIRQARESQRQLPFLLNVPLPERGDRQLLLKLVPLLNDDMGCDTVCALLYDVTEFADEEPTLSRVPARSRQEVRLMKAGDIRFARADNSYCELFSADGAHHCDLSIGELEKRLSPEGFFRVHRSYLVNLRWITKIDRDGCGCVVSCGASEQSLPVSRDRAARFLKVLGIR